MRVFVLGAGSRGNAVVIDDGDRALLIDVGFGPRTLARRARAVRCDLARVRAVVVTHEHGDHARGAIQFATSQRVPILTTRGTWEAIGPGVSGPPWKPIRAQGELEFEGFRVQSTPTSHDAADPVALAVTSTASGARVAIVHDLGRPTPAVRGLLQAAHCVIIEANHDEYLLRTGPYPPSVRQRISSNAGHLSNRATAELLASVSHPGLEAVVLTHLSDACNTPALAREAVRRALGRVGFRGSIHTADQTTPLGPISALPLQPLFPGL